MEGTWVAYIRAIGRDSFGNVYDWNWGVDCIYLLFWILSVYWLLLRRLFHMAAGSYGPDPYTSQSKHKEILPFLLQDKNSGEGLWLAWLGPFIEAEWWGQHYVINSLSYCSGIGNSDILFVL